MTALPLKSGLPYNENVIAPGAQTTSLGDAGPVSALLGGMDSPAAFLPRRVALRSPQQAVPWNAAGRRRSPDTSRCPCANDKRNGSGRKLQETRFVSRSAGNHFRI